MQGEICWQFLKGGRGGHLHEMAKHLGVGHEKSVFFCICLCLCVRTSTVIAIVEVGVASLCGTRSREQVGSGWSRESVLIVFVPQSCLAVVKAASTSWEANCSIYTRRRFHSLFKIYLFIYFYNGRGICNLPCQSIFCSLPKLKIGGSKRKLTPGRKLCFRFIKGSHFVSKQRIHKSSSVTKLNFIIKTT